MFNIFKKKSGKKIFIKDRSSMYVWCNDAHARSLRMKSENVEGKSDYNFYKKKEAEKKIADEKKMMEKGKVYEVENKYETNKGAGWIKEILIPLRDGGSEPSGILGLSWDVTSEKNCEIEREKVQKEVEKIISVFTPVFNNLAQGNFNEKIKVPEEENNFTELYNSGNSAIDNLKQSQEELQNKINQKNEELEASKTNLSNIQGELEQKKGIINQKNEELEANKAELNNTQSELEQEKEKINQKDQELEQERQKVNEANNKLEETKRKHKEFVVSILQDLEEKIKSVNPE